ncbi:hypothetical protein PM10SUCC1_21930 [Propionigenium maris DSM 9537]|uniref:Uncharacterized protein n=1 Tax=Propionigenium maris DSM 9537 TaxID=1123000 RepID=A0A9W6GK86_9FUSO|nr:hypothetical protein [Propionigenium maris]GLI56679.1 hypothetical protein PM10SUCC1_21930 [Propionigenium maris DSM 9537]
MAFYTFEYTLPRGYYLKVIDHYEDTNLTRAYLYRGRRYLQKLINVTEFEENTPKLEIIAKSIEFIEQLEEQMNSRIEVR